MYLNTRLLCSPFEEKANVMVTLSRSITTTPPHQVTYPAGATGKVMKKYRTATSTGFIVAMGDGRKIPIPISFLNLPKSPATKTGPIPRPHQTPL